MRLRPLDWHPTKFFSFLMANSKAALLAPMLWSFSFITFSFLFSLENICFALLGMITA